MSGETEDGDPDGGKRLPNVEGLDTELDLGIDGGGGDGLSGKQRMLIKQWKAAKSAQRDSVKAQRAIRRIKWK